jgi:hypothetical protein
MQGELTSPDWALVEEAITAIETNDTGSIKTPHLLALAQAVRWSWQEQLRTKHRVQQTLHLLRHETDAWTRALEATL